VPVPNVELIDFRSFEQMFSGVVRTKKAQHRRCVADIPVKEYIDPGDMSAVNLLRLRLAGALSVAITQVVLPNQWGDLSLIQLHQALCFGEPAATPLTIEGDHAPGSQDRGHRLLSQSPPRQRGARRHDFPT
jgi:hypothetical protein